jgi:apolipoprotein N-acyltransferase
MRALLLALAAGLVSACGFQPIGWWPLTLAAVAFLVRLIGEAANVRAALVRGWWFGLGHFALGLNWIATAFTYQAAMPAWLGWVAVLLLSLYLAVYPAVAAGLAWRWGRQSRASLVLIFAAAWIVTEWLRAALFTGFAWNPLGVALLQTFFARLATLVGTYGLSGIAILLSGSLLLLVERRWKEAAALAAVPAAAAILLLLAAGPPPQPKPVTLRIVQPDIGQAEKWRADEIEQNLRRLAAMSRAGGHSVRLLLWPESAVTRPLESGLADPASQEEAALLRARVGGFAGPGGVLLTGGVMWRSANGIEVTSATNSIFALDDSGRILARYDKAHLVPYGEYLPMRPILSRLSLSRLAPGDVDFDPGPGPRTFALPGIGKVGFQLCYEMIFSGDVVDKNNRPDFLFNPSNDGWFGRWGPPQHLAQARLRALEEGLPVLRATPNGVSAVIDADGRLLDSLGWHEAGVIDTMLPAARPPTLFARFGNFLSVLLALLLAAAAIAVGRKTR